MRVALTTNARLFKNSKGEYYTQSVYEYNFFTRYLRVFDKVKLVAHVEETDDKKVQGMVRVDGEGMEIFEVPFPHGKVQYIKKYGQIKKTLKNACNDCDAAILRIPDQLAFQLYEKIKGKLPIAVEVTSDPWMLFSPKTYKKGLLRPFLRWHWHTKQKKLCKNVLGTSYVTRGYIQERYPYSTGKNNFTTYYTNTDIDEKWLTEVSREKEDVITLIHVSTSIGVTAKGHRELLTALGELISKGANVQLVLVGGGELHEDSKQIVNKYGLQQHIRFTGSINREQLLNELRNADMFVFPSYVEGLPRVVVEAMATGLACVATELPGIKELLDEKWLVPVKDVTQLEEKIKLLLNDELRGSVGKQNRELANEYSKKNITLKRDEYYLKLKKAAESGIKK